MIRPITLWPFPSEQISRAAESFPVFLTVEMSAGQMVDDVRLAVAGKAPVLLLRPTGRRHPDGGRGPGQDSAAHPPQQTNTGLTTGHADRHGSDGTGDYENGIQADLRPEGLSDALLSGLRPRHRPPARRGSDRRAGHPGPHDRDRPGRLRGADVQLSRRGHDRGRPRAGPRRRHRHETDATPTRSSFPTRATATWRPSARRRSSTPPTGPSSSR